MTASNEDRAQEAVAHLQAAALELIAAMRVVLDVAEDLVRDPGPLLAVAEAAGEVLAPLVERGREAAEFMVKGQAHESGPNRKPRVQHIRVS